MINFNFIKSIKNRNLTIFQFFNDFLYFILQNKIFIYSKILFSFLYRIK
jgi:hypothetical protein